MRAPEIFATAIAADWIDYNGHLRDAYYGLVLSYACDALMDRLGLDEKYRRATQCTLYTLEQHLHFLHEVKQSDGVSVSARVLAADHKRLHVAFDCYCPRYATPVAIGESILLHVRQADPPGAVPFPPEIRRAIDEWVATTASLVPPGPGSRRLELRR